MWGFFIFYFFVLYTLLIPCGKFRLPFLGKATVSSRAALPSPTSACWVFLCFRNPQSSDMDYRIFNVRTWSWLVHVYTHGDFGAPTASQHHILDLEKLMKFSCAPDRTQTWVLHGIWSWVQCSTNLATLPPSPCEFRVGAFMVCEINREWWELSLGLCGQWSVCLPEFSAFVWGVGVVSANPVWVSVRQLILVYYIYQGVEFSDVWQISATANQKIRRFFFLSAELKQIETVSENCQSPIPLNSQSVRVAILNRFNSLFAFAC